MPKTPQIKENPNDIIKYNDPKTTAYTRTSLIMLIMINALFVNSFSPPNCTNHVWGTDTNPTTKHIKLLQS